MLRQITLLLASLLARVSSTVISASDPRVLVSGRASYNADGSRSFDWEGVSFKLTLNNSGSVSINITSTTSGLNRIITHVETKPGVWYEQTRQWVLPGTSVLLVAANLYMSNTIRIFFELEPSFSGATNPNAFFTVNSFILDAGDAITTAPLARRIEVVGDSISAGASKRVRNLQEGLSVSLHVMRLISDPTERPYPFPHTRAAPTGYGAMGQNGACPVMDWSSSNYFSWDRMVCDHFQANCSIVAWSGKGMYENCCDSGETMPSYYLQERGGQAYQATWDFSLFVPDAILVNLGTNDFGHDSGAAWEKAFTDTYLQFMVNATLRYNNPTLPIFLGQGNMNNGAPLHDALIAAATAFNASGGRAFYVDMRVSPVDGCGGHPGTLGHAAMAAAAFPVIGSAMGWV